MSGSVQLEDRGDSHEYVGPVSGCDGKAISVDRGSGGLRTTGGRPQTTGAPRTFALTLNHDEMGNVCSGEGPRESGTGTGTTIGCRVGFALKTEVGENGGLKL